MDAVREPTKRSDVVTVEINHASRAHSRVGASSMERVEHCPGHLLITKDLPDKTSTYAQQGTNAHELMEAKCRKHFFGTEYKWLDDIWDDDMEKYTDVYLEYVKLLIEEVEGEEYAVDFEIRLEFDKKLDMFGTADTIMIYRDKEGRKCGHVIDFKYGVGKRVDVDGNRQLQFYAGGLSTVYGKKEAFHKIGVHIVQPRIKDGIVSTEYSAEEIKKNNRKLKTLARAAIKIDDDNFDVDKHLNEGGWCQFCKAQYSCPKKLMSVKGIVHDTTEIDITSKDCGGMQIPKGKEQIKAFLNVVDRDKVANLVKNAANIKAFIDGTVEYARWLQFEKEDPLPGVEFETSENKAYRAGAADGIAEMFNIDVEKIMENKLMSKTSISSAIVKDAKERGEKLKKKDIDAMIDTFRVGSGNYRYTLKK